MKGNVVTILTNIGSPVRIGSNESYLLKPHGMVFTATKREHVRIHTLAAQLLEYGVSTSTQLWD